MSLPVASLLGSLFALLMVPLSLQVSMRRARVRSAALGNADDEILRRRIRAHGNFAEYAPTALIVVSLLEIDGGNKTLVLSLAIAFLVSRVLHAIGMLYMSTSTLRVTGMLIQHLAFFAAGLWLLSKAL